MMEFIVAMNDQESIEKQVHKNNKSLIARLERVDVTGEFAGGPLDSLLVNDLIRISKSTKHSLTVPRNLRGIAAPAPKKKKK